MSAARTWILANSGFRLQHVTPEYLATFPAVNASTALAVIVNKTPRGAGRYAIEAQIRCDNWMGCDRPPIDALLDFQRAVNAVTP